MKQLTVVITYYNNSKYLNKILSNIKKINDEIDILIIDDGSMSIESNKLENAIKKIKRKNIKYYKNENNMGAGYSKNKAVELANSNYIIFLDSDDYVDDNYYSLILNLLNKESVDIICTNISIDISGVIYYENIINDNLIRDKALRLDDITYEIKSKHILGNKYSASACNKAIRRDLLLKNRFNHNKCDDLTAIIPAVCEAKRVLYIDNLNYYYCQENNSLTRTTNIKNYYDSIDSIILTYNFLKEKNINESLIEIFYVNNFINFIYYTICNNSLFKCFKLSKYLSKNINKDNFSDYLTISNQYLYRLNINQHFLYKILNYIKNKKIITFNIYILYNRLKYKLRKLGG